MPYITNPNASPQTSWTSNDPLQQFVTNSTTWANYLQTYLTNMSAAITTPAITSEWPTISADIPIDWGTGHTTPTIPTATEISGPATDTLVAFAFNLDAFIPDVRVATKERIINVLEGNPLLGQTVWNDLYTDAADDITAAFAAATLQAGNISGMLGELPGEALILLAERTASDQRKALAKVRISAATEQAKAWREDVTHALEAGRAHDQAYGALHMQAQELGLKIAVEKTDASTKLFGAGWQGISSKYAARLAAMQADAIPGELQVKGEANKIALDGKAGDLNIENAKLAQGKGIAEANLYVEQLKYARTMNLDILKTMASLSAHTMGAYLAAGSVHYSVSSSESYSNSNSYSMTKDETPA